MHVRRSEPHSSWKTDIGSCMEIDMQLSLLQAREDRVLKRTCATIPPVGAWSAEMAEDATFFMVLDRASDTREGYNALCGDSPLRRCCGGGQQLPARSF